MRVMNAFFRLNANVITCGNLVWRGYKDGQTVPENQGTELRSLQDTFWAHEERVIERSNVYGLFFVVRNH